jgi:hypothetical protein
MANPHDDDHIPAVSIAKSARTVSTIIKDGGISADVLAEHGVTAGDLGALAENLHIYAEKVDRINEIRTRYDLSRGALDDKLDYIIDLLSVPPDDGAKRKRSDDDESNSSDGSIRPPRRPSPNPKKKKVQKTLPAAAPTAAPTGAPPDALPIGNKKVEQTPIAPPVVARIKRSDTPLVVSYEL